MDKELVKDFIDRLLNEIDLLNLKIGVMDKSITLDEFLIKGNGVVREASYKSDEYLSRCVALVDSLGLGAGTNSMETLELLFGCCYGQAKIAVEDLGVIRWDSSRETIMYAGNRICERCGETKPFSVFTGSACNKCFDASLNGMYNGK